MTMMYRRMALVLAAVALVGCNTQQQKKTRNLLDERVEQTKQGVKEAVDPQPREVYNPLKVSDKVWAGGVSMRLRRGLPLPAKYETARGVGIVSSNNMSLQEIAAAVSAQTGIPVRVAPGVQGPAADPLAVQVGGNDAGAPGGLMLSYEGPLSNLLDQVAGHFGINWRYDGASISFSRFETRVFVVEALPGSQTIKDGMKEDEGSSSSSSSGSSSSSSSGGSSLQQSSEMNVEIKVWEELQQTIQSMLGGVGTVVTAPSSGTITVTTSPELMRTVAKYIQEENQRLSKQIAVNVEIYTVNIAEGDDFSVSFTSALKQLTHYGAQFTTPFGAGAKGANVTLANGYIVPGGNVDYGGNLAVAIIDNKNWGSAGGMFSALSTVGDTTRVAQFPMTTLNNRPVSRRIGRDRSYAASVTSTSGSSSSFSSNQITPGVVREGFSLQLTPRLLDDGRIMLQYSMSLIDIVAMEPFESGEQKIQLPETSTRVFVQQAMLKSGSTMIVGGFDDEATSQSSRGMGNAYNYLLGGGTKSDISRTMMFIAITPQVLDVPHQERD